MRRIRLTGQLAEPISHYTDAVEAEGFLYISGMLPVNAAGELVGGGDVIRQSEQVLESIGEVLRSAEASFDDVVRVGVYVRDMADRERINTVRRATSVTPGRPARWPRSARSPTRAHW
jgi:2-iminobutanoate/2-iminopropanoate deaminase